jgi:hypothetical protein
MTAWGSIPASDGDDRRPAPKGVRRRRHHDDQPAPRPAQAQTAATRVVKGAEPDRRRPGRLVRPIGRPADQLAPAAGVLVDHARAPCPHRAAMIGIADPARAETDLAAGALACPGCTRPLHRWGHAAPAPLRDHSQTTRALDRRARSDGSAESGADQPDRGAGAPVSSRAACTCGPAGANPGSSRSRNGSAVLLVVVSWSPGMCRGPGRRSARRRALAPPSPVLAGGTDEMARAQAIRSAWRSRGPGSRCGCGAGRGTPPTPR